jgi:hypothetical protein
VLCLSAAVAVVGGGATPCRAAETAREAAAADYARGIALANDGLYEAALEQFDSAYTKSPHFAVLYNIGQAQIALGHPLDAIAALTKYLHDGADQVPLSRREQVQAQLGLLEARIAELTITTDTPRAIIRVDGREVGRAPLFQPIRLAAGPHAISATTAAGAEVTRTVLLGEGERQRLELALASAAPARKSGPAATPAPPPAPVSPPPAPPPPPEPIMSPLDSSAAPAPRPSSLRWASYAVGAAGLLAEGAALGVYLWNRDRYGDWRAGNAALERTSPGSAAYQRQAVENNALVPTLTSANRAIVGLAIGGGVALAGAATMFLFDYRARHRGTELSLGWGPGGAPIVAWSARW